MPPKKFDQKVDVLESLVGALAKMLQGSSVIRDREAGQALYRAGWVCRVSDEHHPVFMPGLQLGAVV